MLPKYDNLLLGLAVALLIAFVGYGLLLSGIDFLNGAFAYDLRFRPRSLALIAICINVLPMNWFKKRYYNKSMRGVVIGTFLLAIGWFFYFGDGLLNP